MPRPTIVAPLSRPRAVRGPAPTVLAPTVLAPTVLALAFLALTMPAARASQAEAKDVARNANCPPGKVEVLTTRPGQANEIVYRIACTGQKDASVTVRCIGRMCVLLR